MDANLVLLANGKSRKVFPLPSEVTIVGRRRDCGLRIPLDSVSRRHCQLSWDERSLKIKDLGSRNGTFLNGKQVKESRLNAGDQIKIGPLEFMVQLNGLPAEVKAVGAQGPSPAKPAKAAPGADDEDFADLDDELDAALEGSDVLVDLDLDDLDDV